MDAGRIRVLVRLMSEGCIPRSVNLLYSPSMGECTKTGFFVFPVTQVVEAAGLSRQSLSGIRIKFGVVYTPNVVVTCYVFASSVDQYDGSSYADGSSSVEEVCVTLVVQRLVDGSVDPVDGCRVPASVGSGQLIGNCVARVGGSTRKKRNSFREVFQNEWKAVRSVQTVENSVEFDGTESLENVYAVIGTEVVGISGTQCFASISGLTMEVFTREV